MLELVKPELGQICFGNAFGPFDLGEHEDYVRDQLCALSKLSARKLYPDSDDEHLGEYVEDFKNDVFEMHPYWWGPCCETANKETAWKEQHPHAASCPFPASYEVEPCTCGVDDLYWKWKEDNIQHEIDCRDIMPNFRCGPVEIRWYKYIGRGMSLETDHEISREEWQQIFERCFQSLK